MRTEHLEYLLDLQKTLSLTKTAENYFTSHQVISNAVKSLENELNVTILYRTHKGVLFSDAGMLICDYAKKMAQEQQLLLTNLTPYFERNQELLKGNLDIYTIPRFSNKHFLKFYTNYCKKNAELDIHLRTISGSNFFKLLPINVPFFFFTTAHNATLISEAFCSQLQENKLTYEIISQHTLGICIARNSSLIEDAKTFSSEKLSSLPIVVFNYSLDEIEMLQANTFTKNLYLADNFESQKQLIKTGNYLGMCTPLEFRHLFQSRDNSLIFLQNKSLEAEPFYYIVIYSKQMQAYPVLQDVLASLRKYYH